MVFTAREGMGPGAVVRCKDRGEIEAKLLRLHEQELGLGLVCQVDRLCPQKVSSGRQRPSSVAARLISGAAVCQSTPLGILDGRAVQG